MRKRLLAIVATVAMIMTMLPSMAFAATTAETDLQNKLEAGGTIKLTQDVVVEDGLNVPAGVTVTLDLNGYTISQTKAQTAGYQMILNDGNLTITDSKGTGKISYTDSGNGGEYISDTIYNRAILVINGGTIENLSSKTVASNGYPHAVDTYSGIRDTSVTINGGTIYCVNYSAIRMFCVSATYKADLVINGGTIKGAVDMQNGTKDKAIGSLTINNGTFETTANANNIRFANWNGGATEYGITAEIKKGSFDGGITTAYVPTAANWDKAIVKGGTFEVELDEDYLAAGVEQKEDGTVACDHSTGTISEKAEVPATCGSTGLTAGKVCSACGEYVEGGVTIPATGKHSYKDGKCTVCKADEPATTPTEPTEPAAGTTTETPKTGDTSNMAAPFALAGLAVAAMAAAVLARKRQSQK